MSTIKTLVPIILVIWLSLSASGQDHAPSISTCRADKNLWMSQLTDYANAEAEYTNKGIPNRTAVMLLTVVQLNERTYEMGQCAVVDPELSDSYDLLVRGYGEAVDERYRFFVERHHLLKQMRAEDAAGMRH